MAEARGRAQRRHVREKATIDHLVRDVYESRRRLTGSTRSAAPPRPPAYRSRIRSARTGILARAAYPLFDDNHRLTSITGQNLCIV